MKLFKNQKSGAGFTRAPLSENKTKSGAGFTLVELLVVIAIILLLTALVVSSYRTGGKQLALQSSAQKIKLDLRDAQNSAMSAAEYKGQVPAGGYGIYFPQDDDFYILFADCDGESDFDVGLNLCNGSPEEIKRIDLERGVEIKCLFDCPGSGWGYILFTPPDPKITIGPWDRNELKITLCLKNDSNITKDIIINKVGKIDIK